MQNHRRPTPAARWLVVAVSATALIATSCSGDGPTLTTEGVTPAPPPALTSDDDNATSTSGDVIDNRTRTVTDVTDDGPRLDEFDFPPLLTSDEAFVVTILEELGHDPRAYTQGLEFVNGSLYESRGEYGESALTRIDPLTGQVRQAQALNDDIFAEGLTVVEDIVIQLTWRENVALVYDLASLEVIDQFEYDGEGWGLCFDGISLWMSNGTDQLTQRDPDTFDPITTVDVTLDGRAVFELNELECHDGRVWANVFGTNFVVVIEPSTGEVVARIDASVLRQSLDPSPDAEVLNGIAFDPRIGQMVMTGKYWPQMFVVEFEPCTGSCVPASFPFTDGN